MMKMLITPDEDKIVSEEKYDINKIQDYLVKSFAKREMPKTEQIDFTLGIHKEFPWLINCEESMDATIITNIFDIKQMILDTMTDDEDDMSL